MIERDMSSASEVGFGVRFGGSSAAVAACRVGRAQVLANDAGERSTPALVTYLPSEKLVGHAARQALHRNMPTTATCMATLIGHRMDDPGIHDIITSLSCKVMAGEEGGLCYSLPVDGKELCVPVENPLTEVFKILWETARAFDSGASMRAVLAVPAHYSQHQKDIVSTCASEAGFSVLRVVKEPPAACLAYGIGQDDRQYKGLVLVYGLGAHSLTLSLLEVSGGLYHTITSHGLSSLGGHHFDLAIRELLAAEFQRQWRMDLRGNARAMHKLLVAAETAKHSLSTNQTTSIHLDSLHEGSDLQYTLTRGRFEGICSSLFRSCLDPIPAFLHTANVALEQVDQVVLLGGSTRLPRLQQLLREALPSSRLHSSTAPEEVAALGAALQAGLLLRGEGPGEGAGEGAEPGEDVPCTAMELWMAFPDSADAVAGQLAPLHTPLPCQRLITTAVKPSQPRQRKYCLELREGPNKDRVVAKIFVPVTAEEQLIETSLHWNRDNAITLRVCDPVWDWSRSVQLQCEPRDSVSDAIAAD